MTLGSRRTSSGVPSAIFSPWSRTRHPVADAHDHLHVVLDEQDGQAELGPQPGDELHHRRRLGRVHAGGRLVEEQQDFGSAGEGPRDLQASLVAVGQVLGELVLRAAQAHEGQQLAGPARRPPPPRRRWRASREHASSGFECSRECIPTSTFSQGGHVLEEADVLERPADARRDHVVGAGAPEDPEAVQQPRRTSGGRMIASSEHRDRAGPAPRARSTAQRQGRVDRDAGSRWPRQDATRIAGVTQTSGSSPGATRPRDHLAAPELDRRRRSDR